MKAVVATKYGGPDTLAMIDRPAPTVGASDVLIGVKAASLNPLDFKIREGKLKLVSPQKPPILLGCDAAGVVLAVGAKVTRFARGDEVFVRLAKDRIGALAEQTIAVEDLVAKKPANVSFEEAAAIPLVSLTSLQALRECAACTTGQRVLIHAGSGGVGAHAIQIAKILGLHVTTTTSTKNIEFVKSLGADEVIDYTAEKLGDKKRDFDMVFDTLGTTELDSIAATRRGGVVVGIGGDPDAAFAKARLPAIARPVIWFMTRKRRAACAKAGVKFVYLFMRPDGDQLAELAGWMTSGNLKPIVHKAYPFAEYKEAFAELERGRARGKIVITL